MFLRILFAFCMYGIAAMFAVLFVAILCDAPEEFTGKVFKLGVSLGGVLVTTTAAEVCLGFFGRGR